MKGRFIIGQIRSGQPLYSPGAKNSVFSPGDHVKASRSACGSAVFLADDCRVCGGRRQPRSWTWETSFGPPRRVPKARPIVRQRGVWPLPRRVVGPSVRPAEMQRRHSHARPRRRQSRSRRSGPGQVVHGAAARAPRSPRGPGRQTPRVFCVCSARPETPPSCNY